MTINSDAVLRHASILSAPDEAVLCWAFGHRWEPGPVIERRDYGGRVWAVQATCPCTRLRSETIDPHSGELMKPREYGGGHGLNARLPVERQEARLEWGRRTRAKQAAAAKDKRAAKETTAPKSTRRRGATVTQLRTG